MRNLIPRFLVALGVVAALGVAALPSPAQARGHHAWGWGLGVGLGVGALWGWPYYYPYEAYPYPYPSPYYAPGAPAATILQQAPAAPPPVYYYCKNPEGYYPYIQSCQAGWQTVNVIPQDAPQAPTR